jgi:hypothetical protein
LSDLTGNKVSKENTKKDRINWHKVIEHVGEEYAWFKERGIKPSLRTMFYRLVSKEIIPNTEQAYKSLSKATVKARIDGKLPWDIFSDEGRLVIDDSIKEYRTIEHYVQSIINYLNNAHRHYTIPRWFNQPHYVEIWIEKHALKDTFLSFLEDRQVIVAVNKGYAGWSFLYENCKRLQKIKASGKEIHILYFGDFDPSGDDMDRHLNQALSQFDLSDIDLQRVAVTQKQIEKFHLPPVPNSDDTLDKVKRDTRTNGFIEKYGKLYVVELDALLAIVPDEFKTMVQESVDQFFDEDIYQLELAKHSPEEIKRLVCEKVRFLNENSENE